MGSTCIDMIKSLSHEFTIPETEESWRKRQDLCSQLSEYFEKRDVNVPLRKEFVHPVKTQLANIITIAGSERTTLSGQGCRLVSNIARALGSEIQSQLDIVLPSLIEICGSTKSVNQKNANECIVTVCKHVGYSTRLVYHICSAFKEKRVPPRTYAPEWLRIVFQSYKSQIDPDKDSETIRSAIYSGLTDGQVKVRENTRATYWQYAQFDAQGARVIMSGLNAHAAAALKDDPNNPNRTTKSARQPRSESALAQIRAQNKQRLQQHRGHTAVPVQQSEDCALASTNEPGMVRENSQPKSTEAPVTQAPNHEVIQKPVKHHKADAAKDAVKPSSSSSSTSASDSRPLLSAPVRRPRIVATPISSTAPPGQRPGSRGDPAKKSTEAKDKALQEKATGRQTPIVADEKSAVPAAMAQQSKRSGRQTPVIVEDKNDKSAVPQTSTYPPKKTGRQTPVVIKDTGPPAPSTTIAATTTLAHQSKETSSRDATSPKLDEHLSSAHNPLPRVRPFTWESQGNPRTEPPAEKSASLSHVPDGKENTNVTKFSTKHASRPDDLTSARRSLAAAMDFLRHGTLDALGYRRLRKLVETFPDTLITTQAQFDELYELLIRTMGSLDEVTEPRDKRMKNLNHQFFHRHIILITIMNLLRQYRQYGEPRPGMTLCALLIARCNHSQGHASVVDAIDDAAAFLCSISDNPLPAIDAVLDTLQQLESTIMNNDPILDSTMKTASTPPSILEGSHTHSLSSTKSSLTVEPGSPDLRAHRLPDRLPIAMSCGLQILIGLLRRVAILGQSLYSVQEDRMASLAEQLLATYNSVIKRRVMEYCTALHRVIKPERRFYGYFTNEADKNLIHYYVAGATGRGAVPSGPADPSSWETLLSEPSTFDPGSDPTWDGLGTTTN